MRYFHVFPLFAALAGAAWAQPQADRNVDSKTVQEQRRAQLRLILSTPRVREAQEKEQALESEMQERHLSAQEKADLRQQLRQQQRDAKGERR